MYYLMVYYVRLSTVGSLCGTDAKKHPIASTDLWGPRKRRIAAIYHKKQGVFHTTNFMTNS